jgi:hypothetical protein
MFMDMGFKGQFARVNGRPLWRNIDPWLKLSQRQASQTTFKNGLILRNGRISFRDLTERFLSI